MPRRKERNTPSIIRDASDVIDAEISRRLNDANESMGDINASPKLYGLSRKQEVVDDLNWAVRIALPKEEVTGTFIVGKRDDQTEDEAAIYLKPNDEG